MGGALALARSTPNPPSIAEKQQPSSKTHKKQAPPLLNKLSMFQVGNFVLVKHNKFNFSLAHTILVQPLHSSAH